MKTLTWKLGELIKHTLLCTGLVSRLRNQPSAMIFIPWLSQIHSQRRKSSRKRKDKEMLMSGALKESEEESLELVEEEDLWLILSEIPW